MTFREKLKLEHPECIDDHQLGGCARCPKDYGYEADYDKSICKIINPWDLFTANARCTRCWNREIPGTEPTNTENEREEKEMEQTTLHVQAARKTKAELLEEISALREEVAKLERYSKYEDSANETHAVMQSFINAGFTREEAFALTKEMIIGAFKVKR